jgi:hypothetical protein
MLTGLRQSICSARTQTIHPGVPEILLWIAAGVDHASDLREQTGLTDREIRRLLATLSGRSYLNRGRWCHSPIRLVRARDHPHRRGLQWVLTENGEELLQGALAPQNQK